MSTRRASHSGSWYPSSARELNTKLEGWLSKASPSFRPAKAIIAPHAGYTYCGSCGAHAYKQVDPSRVKRIFILGPSHHKYLPGCALSPLTHYQTPLYNLEVDTTIIEELLSTGEFDKLERDEDESEHSIELHLPYIAKVMESKSDQFKIVPILVGSLNPENEIKYGRLLSKYLARPEFFFVISSDFCHWGKRFKYTPWDRSFNHIYESIEALDRKGMDVIEKLDPQGFSEYLKEYGNTICGRHPIGVLLNAVEILRRMNGVTHPWTFKFVHYSQSNACDHVNSSSVSYAAGVLFSKP
ncbi:PREDICTED: protein MEMO1-like [Acropora digitifera]|uniref:protein MEMO1-like n=1 Tax=Acropora digitifera TaxID=70779 RepID=UPI00077B1F0A|nr:PREDICTED: protein MEMO1-like [Acropora digitifera]